MMNFCIITLLILATRKVLWLINSSFMNNAENKIKRFFSAVEDILVFIVEISLATKTEQAICSKCKQIATESRNYKIKATAQKRSKLLLTLLEPVTQKYQDEGETVNNRAA